LIDPRSKDPLQQENPSDERSRMRRVLQDQSELIMSNRVLTRVFQELAPANAQPVSNGQIDELRKNLKVTPAGGEPLERSILFFLEYSDDSPARAAQVAAAITQSYLDAYQEITKAKNDADTQASSQLEQARTAQSVNQGKQFLTLIDKPEVPSKPFSPNRLLLVIGGLFSGIFMGIAVALTVAHFDHSLRTVCDIEKYLKVPVLGSVQNVLPG
jgi:capsular polysaccharide biosynthesis protein